MSAELHFISALQPLADVDTTRWVYLGQNPTTLKTLSKLLGASRQISTGERLDAIAHEVKSDFVNWVAQLAVKEASAPAFWDITFTARSPETSDLFPLLCLALLGRELSQKSENIRIFTDDPWLYGCLQQNGVSGCSDQAAQKTRRTQVRKKQIRIPLARLSLFIRGLSRILIARHQFRRIRFSNQDVILVSYAYQKALEKMPYRDPFFGDLSDILRNWDFRPIHLFPLHTPAGLFKAIRKSEGLALARWARLRDLLQVLLVRAQLRKKADPFAGLNIESLLKREFLNENSSNRYALNRWQSLTWEQFAKQRPRRLVHIFENHPWEKGLNHALREYTRRIGYQHATVPDLLMNYTPGGSKEVEFHPNRIIANSRETENFLTSIGWPRSMLTFGGALRHSAKEVLNPNSEAHNRNQRTATLYVALPGHAALCTAILDALRDAARTALPKRPHPLQILLKFHPSLAQQDFLREPIESATVTDQPLSRLKSEIDSVLFVSSTVGLEALLMGLPVCRFVPESILTLNPIPGPLNERVRTVSLSSLPQMLTEITQRQERLAPLSEWSDVLYSPFQPETWKEALSNDLPEKR